MILSHVEIQTLFSLKEGSVNVLVVENPQLFTRFCTEIKEGIACDLGNFCLSDGDKILKMSKCCAFVSDLLCLEVESKKVASKLFSDLKTLAETEYLAEWYGLKAEICGFLEKLNAESLCALEYDAENDVTSLLKAFNVRVFQDCESLLERVVAYVKASAKYLGVKQFFFVNLKSFLGKAELQLLYKECSLEGVGLFLMESSCREALAEEKVLVIDQDLCEIVVS